VTYRVLSADGHPAEGSYVFVVGEPPETIDASAFDLHRQLGHEGHGEGAATQLSTREFLIYAVRVFYFGALLLAAGWFIWSAWAPQRSPSFDAGFREWSGRWGLLVSRAFLVAALLCVFFHALELMEGEPLSEWGRMLTETDIGRAWAVMLALALIGPLARTASRPVGLLWAGAILLVESFSGHAAAYEPAWLTIGTDFVHLLGAAIWAGGLAMLAGLWFADRKEAARFAAVFSGPALWSMLALAASGLVSVWLFLPGPEYLFYTGWGILLLVKTGLTLLAVLAGGLIRLRMKRGGMPQGALLKADAAVMAAIVVIVGLFTYISPLPANEPVHAHKMGEDMHLTLRISPNAPGDNTFIVKVWLPEPVGEPKSVALRLRSEDRPDAGPIDVPLERYEDTEIDNFTGFVKATYRAEGPYLPFPGRWTAEIRVTDAKDNEKVHREPFRNY
jgi:copper transport protein